MSMDEVDGRRGVRKAQPTSAAEVQSDWWDARAEGNQSQLSHH